MGFRLVNKLVLELSTRCCNSNKSYGCRKLAENQFL